MGWSPFRKLGLTYHRPALSSKGYTLMSAIRGDATYLLDMEGRIVHRWRYDGLQPFLSRLLPTGRLLTLAVSSARSPLPPAPFDQPPPPLVERVRRLGGNATHVVELDWESNIVWQYENEMLHHDIARLPNGNTMVIEWVELPDALGRQVRGGVRRPREKFPPVLGDDFVEIDPAGREVARISQWQALDPRRHTREPLVTRWEWTHTNSIDLTPEGDILFSSRHISTIGIIERASGRLRWEYGRPNLSVQHHATLLPSGNVQVFDNGTYMVGLPHSRVLEIDPRTNTVTWQYAAEPPLSFFSPHISGADRLPNGNVLVCEGGSGRLFEVTRRGEIVWEWLNPFPGFDAGRAGTAVFRAYRYGPDYPGLAGRTLDPDRYADLNRLHGLA